MNIKQFTSSQQANYPVNQVSEHVKFNVPLDTIGHSGDKYIPANHLAQYWQNKPETPKINTINPKIITKKTQNKT